MTQDYKSDPLVELARLIGQSDPFLAQQVSAQDGRWNKGVLKYVPSVKDAFHWRPWVESHEIASSWWDSPEEHTRRVLDKVFKRIFDEARLS